MILETRQFVVVDDKRLLSKGKYKYSGVTAIFPIGEDIPVIVKGTGCVGVTKVEEIYIDETGTQIGFDSVTKVDAATAKAFYNLYRASVGVKAAQTSNHDMEDYEDQVIPGLYRPRSGVRFE